MLLVDRSLRGVGKGGGGSGQFHDLHIHHAVNLET